MASITAPHFKVWLDINIWEPEIRSFFTKIRPEWDVNFLQIKVRSLIHYKGRIYKIRIDSNYVNILLDCSTCFRAI